MMKLLKIQVWPNKSKQCVLSCVSITLFGSKCHVACLDFHLSQQIHILEWKLDFRFIAIQYCANGVNRSTYPNGQQGRTGLKMS